MKSTILFDYNLSLDSVAWDGVLLIEQDKNQCSLFYTSGNGIDHNRAITAEKAQKLIKEYEGATTQEQKNEAIRNTIQLATERVDQPFPKGWRH